jgi:hypothetical protein
MSSLLQTPRFRPVPFIGLITGDWTYSRESDYTYEDPESSSVETDTQSIDGGGQFLIAGTDRPLWTEDGGYQPDNGMAGLLPGEGRTMFNTVGSPGRNRIGIFNLQGSVEAGDPFSASWEQTITTGEDEEAETSTLTGNQIGDLRAFFSLQINRSSLVVTFTINAEWSGTLTLGDAEPVPFTSPLNLWTATHTITTDNPFGTFLIELDRDIEAYDLEDPIGTESLTLTLTIEPWAV